MEGTCVLVGIMIRGVVLDHVMSCELTVESLLFLCCVTHFHFNCVCVCVFARTRPIVHVYHGHACT